MDENYETESDEPEERFEIEVVDDTPEADRGKEYRSKGDVDASDDEISQYSDNVKKRIKELSRAYHDERREIERLGLDHRETVPVGIAAGEGRGDAAWAKPPAREAPATSEDEEKSLNQS